MQETSGRSEGRLARLVELAERHHKAFWTLHSLWALGWGAAFVLLGAERPQLLRWGLVSVGAVWLTSLVLPVFLEGRWVPVARRGAARSLVLWGQKWLLQGLAFFLIPLYHRSATYPSRQILFMSVLVLAALAATIDVVYDEVITRKRLLLGLFLAFVAFATMNVTLPMVWRVGGLWNLAASGALATAVFVSFVAGRGNGRPARAALRAALGALFFLVVVTLGRPSVPPAPLRLASVHFGTSLGGGSLDFERPLDELRQAAAARVVAVAAIRAPAGLAEGVRHVWSVDGRVVFETRIIEIAGGRQRGFRSWSGVTLRGLRPGQRVRLDVETAHGQLIGRAEIPVRL
ncbi:MAG: DUF2914 domain-containing protein [Thermoanaerobaculia bacterium]|nr:DUF2914 domain-containing protein [Thermoanaerobaculia bacterium]